MLKIKRNIEETVRASLQAFPVAAIVGPRQVGKTTLAKKLCNDYADAIYLDLERPSDLAKLSDAEFFLREHQDKLVCLDEIQRLPHIFPLIRSLVDEKRRPGRFMILGSASPDLLRQSSETLAGRIAYHELAPLSLSELAGTPYGWKDLLERGGFPDSLFAGDISASLSWRENFLSTFMERDLANMGLECSPVVMRRLWLMVAHMNGQIMNYSKLGQSLDVSHPTVKRYLDILTGSFMLTRLEPYVLNIKKRLVKSPKYYLADAGIFNSLLDLDTFDDLYNHPGYGSAWEGLAIKHLLLHFKPKQPFGFFRSHVGQEIDFIFARKGEIHAFEFKTSSNPKIDPKILELMDEVKISHLTVITPQSDKFSMLGGRVRVQSLDSLLMETGANSI